MTVREAALIAVLRARFVTSHHKWFAARDTANFKYLLKFTARRPRPFDFAPLDPPLSKFFPLILVSVECTRGQVSEASDGDF